ncbi:MAG: LolA family protein [Candidatus Margulisiibacteriota bacterium]
MGKRMVSLVMLWFLAFSVLAADLSLKEVVAKIQANQGKIKDMYAETTTTITSSMTIPGQKDKGPQKMVQKGKMWTKGKDKSKIEMLSPMRQTTVTNGDKVMMINPDTGQKIVQDLKKLREKSGMPDTSRQMDLEEAMKYFNLSVKREGKDYVIVGEPKEENKILGKMEFYLDPEEWLPVKILMYDPKGKLMSQSEIQYQKISDAYVPLKNISNITTPMGMMKVEMEFSKVKVNQGISDKEFAIE